MKKLCSFCAAIFSFSMVQSQNVGVGASTPVAKLDLRGNPSSPTIPGTNSTGVLRIGISSNEGIDFGKMGASPYTAWIQAGYNGTVADPLSFQSLGGNVGIGTSSPLSKLDIEALGDGAELLRFTTDRPWLFKQTNTGINSTLTLQSTVDDKTFEILSQDGLNHSARFLTNNAYSKVLLVPEAGEVGIGITEAAAKLHVNSNSALNDPQLRLTETSADDYARIKLENELEPGIYWDLAGRADSVAANSKLNFYYANQGYSGDKVTITGDGNVGIGTTSPGNRLRVNGNSTSSQHVLSVGTNYSGNVQIRAVEGFSTPATGYGIGGYFLGGFKGIESTGSGGSAAGTVIGVHGLATGTTGTRIGMYGAAIGGSTNWAGYFAEGNVQAENNLYVTGSVGIGTSNPGNKLRVNGSVTSSQHVFSAGSNYVGNVHIRAVEGFSTPATGYGIGGYFWGGNKGIEATGSGGAATGTVIGVQGFATGTAGTRIGLYGVATGGSTNWAGYFAQGNVYITNQLRIGSDAQAGVPGYMLMVDGKVIAEEVRVQLSTNWPDYVFEKDYPLLSLADLEKSIRLNGHLPGIPSAEEVQADGVCLGDMQRRMMEKIEELTLYIMELNNQNELLGFRIEELENTVKSKDQ